MASDKDIDEMIKKLESMKSGKKKSYSAQRLEKLNSKPESELTLDEKMEKDELWRSETDRAREKAFEDAWTPKWKKDD